jgi:hypothetical protein
MTKEAPMTNDECAAAPQFVGSSFELRHSLVIGVSSLGIFPN